MPAAKVQGNLLAPHVAIADRQSATIEEVAVEQILNTGATGS
jgi:hypothetical protein